IRLPYRLTLRQQFWRVMQAVHITCYVPALLLVQPTIPRGHQAACRALVAAAGDRKPCGNRLAAGHFRICEVRQETGKAAGGYTIAFAADAMTVLATLRTTEYLCATCKADTLCRAAQVGRGGRWNRWQRRRADNPGFASQSPAAGKRQEI